MRIAAIMYGQPYTTQSHNYEYGIFSFISGTIISGNFALCDTFLSRRACAFIMRRRFCNKTRFKMHSLPLS